MLAPFVIKIASLATLLFIPPLFLFSRPAGPTTTAVIKEFFSVDRRCPAPCVMGIALEETTAEEALAILEGHDWVGDITIQRGASGAIHAMSWGWSGSQPTFINPEKEAILTLNFSGKRITSVTIATQLPLGDLWQMIGDPTKTTFYGESSGMMAYLGGFTDAKLHTYGRGACPATANTFWRINIEQLVWLSPYKDADSFFNVESPYRASSCRQYIFSNGSRGG